jgi:hypothetical protein
MWADLDMAELKEVSRRIVTPVVEAMMRPGALTGVDVGVGGRLHGRTMQTTPRVSPPSGYISDAQFPGDSLPAWALRTSSGTELATGT